MQRGKAESGSHAVHCAREGVDEGGEGVDVPLNPVLRHALKQLQALVQHLLTPWTTKRREAEETRFRHSVETIADPGTCPASLAPGPRREDRQNEQWVISSFSESR